ncbi:hypothetical protein ACOMHN_047045 [Nucella lapillus]
MVRSFQLLFSEAKNLPHAILKMTCTTFLAITVIFGILCFPEVRSSFTRKSRAFKSDNFQRHPYKRSSLSFDNGNSKLPLASFEPTWLLNEGIRDIPVEEMADRLMKNRHLALDFVITFMDTDGDRLISASEILPPSQRRRR